MDPARLSGIFSRTPRIWKTHVRLGVSQLLKRNVVAFAAIRDNDFTSPLIVLRFDDGHASIYQLAFPATQRYGYPGMNFIPSA
ncbi:MAG: hypothetical protein ACE5H0_03495 [Bacteroidota bacterium]